MDSIEDCLTEGKFKRMLFIAADQTANYCASLFLPILTVVSGMMGFSTCITHLDGVDLEEPNVLWTVVASPPGK